MIKTLKIALVAAAAFAGVALVSAGSASAAPVRAPIAAVEDMPAVDAQPVRWACDVFGRCKWKPNRPVYGYGYYGAPRPHYAPRPYYGRPAYRPHRQYRRW